MTVVMQAETPVASRTGQVHRRLPGCALAWLRTESRAAACRATPNPANRAATAYANAGGVVRLDYRPAPDEWGNPVIRYWAHVGADHRYPDEIDHATVLECAKQAIMVNKYERSLSARVACIERWGVTCSVCGLDFEKFHGDIGAGYIHVHHLKPLSGIGQRYELDHVKDLRPVFPNCHAMLHRRVPAFTINELKQIIASSKTAP